MRYLSCDTGVVDMTSNMTKGKHLTYDERDNIQAALDMNSPLAEIAKQLGKDPRTISKEIKRNRVMSTRNLDTVYKSCHYRKTCTKKQVCGAKCERLCKKCNTFNCYNICSDFSVKRCSTLERYPYVCNGCKNTTNCKLEKYKYRAKIANAHYKDLLKSSREGIDLSQKELDYLDDLITPLVLRGQSLKHIHVHHKSEIGCSQRTLYNYFDMNLFTARNIDLPRKVKYRPRKKSKSKIKNDQRHRIGRTYEDFTNYTAENPDIPVVEMDTVYGKKGEQVILTLFFRNTSLMLGLLLDACTIACVTAAIDQMYEALGSEVFRKNYPVILTDNGSEFKAPERIEYDELGETRTKVFYCNPMASYQKPHIEKNHEFIRCIIPKGKSFKGLTQEKVTLMMNHINSVARESLNDQTPFKLAQLLQSNSLLDVMSLKYIPADEVHLKPALFK
jgi:IS30 family transposase